MRRGLILGILGFLVITAGWWFLFMSGKSGEISEFNDQTATAKIEGSTLEARRNELQSLAAKEGEYRLALSEIQNSIPAFPNGAALIEDINSIAIDTGVDLLTLSPNPPTPSTVEGLYEISTTVRFEAPYFKVLSVLFAIEDLERLVRVDQIAIDSALDDDGTNLLTVTLTATAFSLSDLGVGVATDTGDGTDAGAPADGDDE
jgi:Tfp pilus assembly protein PilO